MNNIFNNNLDQRFINRLNQNPQSENFTNVTSITFTHSGPCSYCIVCKGGFTSNGNKGSAIIAVSYENSVVYTPMKNASLGTAVTCSVSGNTFIVSFSYTSTVYMYFLTGLRQNVSYIVEGVRPH